MSDEVTSHAGTAATDAVSFEELQLATRNHGMPLEALRYDVTPIGMHFLLTHYDVPDTSGWQLQVGGRVDTPAVLGLDELRAHETVTRRVTMECAGNGRARLRPRPLSQPWLNEAIGTGGWTGTPVVALLDALGVWDDATEVVFTGADRGLEGGVEQHYARSLRLEEIRETGALLAWELNGMPLPPQHGAPLRLVVPGWYGMASVKWLRAIDVVGEPFDGYQQVRAYRFRQVPEEPGEPVRRIAVRSLMVPPGIPDFYTRHRIVDRGVHELCGRAWSGHGPIASVEVSVDGGRTWEEAELDRPDDPAAWTGWRSRWEADRPGEQELRCRATDEVGNRQPDEPVCNLGGYAVNAVHRCPVTVR